MMSDFSEKKKAQVYDNLRIVMQICIDRIVNLNKDGKGKQDAEALRDDFAYAFHCMDLCSECRWIPVSERMPVHGVDVLICDDSKTVSKAWYASDRHRYFIADSDFYCDELDVTHWMPLPEPPEV